MRVGGPADLFATVHNAFELRALVRFARSRGLPHFVLGRGSDLVIADAGIRGLVIQDRAEGSRVDGERYIAEAGVPMARAATETQQAGLTGLEFGLAIPGTVGGAVWANAGAHDADVAAVLESARVLDADGTRGGRAGRGARRWPTATAASSTRAGTAAARDSSLDATFRLDARPTPTRSRRRLDEIRRWRQAHQPLGLPSAGSVFRNPAGDSAGRLIDAAGLKGHRIGGAVVSEKHANFIVNDQKGTAADVRRLGEHVRAESSASARRRARVRDRVRRRLVRLGGRGRAMTDRADAEPPVVVLLGGPSAEHDVSIVSGTAIADALARARPRRRRRSLIDLDGRWWWLPADHRRGRPPAARLRRPGRARRRRPASRRAPRSTGWRRTDPRAGRVHRAPRPVRRGRHGPGAARGGRPGLHRAPASRRRRSAWTRRCSSGCAAGIGLPVVDWREVRAARWATDRDARPGRARGVRRGQPATRG